MITTIAKVALVSTVAGGLNLAFTVPARAQASGRPCTVTSAWLSGDLYGGVLEGGPVVADAQGAEIQMKCTVQVGAANSAHSGTDAAAANGPSLVQATTMPPSPVFYSVPLGSPVYVCTQVTVDGVTYYRNALTSAWSTSDGVRCADEDDSGAFDPLDSIPVEIVDPLVCGPLGSLAPGVPVLLDIDETGDVDLLGGPVWNCPPYES